MSWIALLLPPPLMAHTSLWIPLRVATLAPRTDSTEEMLKALDPPVKSLDEFVKQVLPSDILSSNDLEIIARPGDEDGYILNRNCWRDLKPLLRRIRL